MNEKLKKIFKLKILILTTILSFLITGCKISKDNIDDVQNAKKAEKMLNELDRVRVAIDNYYQLTGKFPELTRENVWNNLRELDYYDENGKLISFAEIYGENELFKTCSGDRLEESNVVYDVQNFKEGTEIGGWNYNYSGRTGEIHANLPYNVYLQGIKWNEY